MYEQSGPLVRVKTVARSYTESRSVESSREMVGAMCADHRVQIHGAISEPISRARLNARRILSAKRGLVLVLETSGTEAGNASTDGRGMVRVLTARRSTPREGLVQVRFAVSRRGVHRKYLVPIHIDR